jgi:hypothetical protein
VRDSWCTPRWLADAIGEFDLDPCSNPRSHVKARKTYQVERGEDGLDPSSFRLMGSCRTFINPPYSRDQVQRWIDAYKHTQFCFLLRFDPSTKWFQDIYDASGLIAIPRGRRINFEPPPGVSASSNVFPHALFYRNPSDATGEVIRACVAWRKKPRT